MPPKKPASRQDYLWLEHGRFRRCDMTEFGDVQKFANIYKPEQFQALQNIVAHIKPVSPKYTNDTTGTLDVGAALSGEPECFIRREHRPSKRLRMGVNCSNDCCRAGLDQFKAFTYAALALTAKRMGYVIESELVYGGMSESRRSKVTNHSIRVELGVNIPVHVLAGYATNHGIDHYQEHMCRLQESGAPLMGVHYQTQDAFMREIIDKEFDLCMDRLTESDTFYTMAQYLRRNLDRFRVSYADQNDILQAASKFTQLEMAAFTNWNHELNK